MKTRRIILAVALLTVCSALAKPLSLIIFEEDAKLRKRVDAWQVSCSDKGLDQTCADKRYKLSADIGRFIAMVNDEVALLRDPSDQIDEEFRGSLERRLREMEFAIDCAIHWQRCMSRPASDPVCAAEQVELGKRQQSLAAP